MTSDDDSNDVEDSTKQVDRDALNVVLNKSVDSQKILERVNAQIGEDVHAEGTAKVDRDAVARYLEAARSGEFLAADGQPTETSGPVPGRAPESAEILAEASESVFESSERDGTGPKAAVFRRTPSRGSKSIPTNLKLPPPPKLPSRDAMSVPSPSVAAEPAELAELAELADPEAGEPSVEREFAEVGVDTELTDVELEQPPTEVSEALEAEERGAVDFTAIQEAMVAKHDEVVAEPAEPIVEPKKGISPWIGLFLLAILGTLMGAAVGALVVFLS